MTLVGDERTFEAMVDNISEQKRYSGLKDRILEQAQNARMQETV